MKFKNLLFSLLCLLIFFFIQACAPDNKALNQEEKEHKSVRLKAKVEHENEKVNKVLKSVEEGQEKSSVDFRVLKKLLPERMGGMKRVAFEGEKAGLFGLNFSHAKAIYEKGDATIEIQIVDGGGIAGVINTLAKEFDVHFDHEMESRDQYDKNTTIQGYKARERYDSRMDFGEITIQVDKRFLVDIEGTNVKEKEMKRMARDMDLDKLKKLGK